MVGCAHNNGKHMRRSYSTADISVTEADFAVDQEPEPSEDDVLSDLYSMCTVSFSISGQTLARLLGKQRRVLSRALEKLSDKQAQRALLDISVPDEVRKSISGLLRDLYVYDYGIGTPRLKDLQWSDGQDIAQVKISPREERIDFVDFDVDINYTVR